MMMWWDHMGGYGGWMGFGAITMLLFWIILNLAIVVLWRAVARAQPTATASREKSAIQILEERYARGEIGKEEFVEKRKDLTGGSGP
jgi:putative membrane protein